MPIRVILAALVVALTLPVAAGCSRDKEEPAGARLPTPTATATPIFTVTPEAAGSPTPMATPTAAATPSPSPGATPAPGPPPPPPPPRLVNGLMVVDEVFVGVVRESGGLRIRSAPRVDPGNVVGSVAQGATVNVEGRVLNGQEAETGKGTVWLIVGPNQYIYAPEGYVERIR